MRTTIVLLATLIGSLQAEIVLWKAAGAITVTSGNFVAPALPPGEPITIRMTYDDRATPDKPYNGSLGRVDTDYRSDIDLMIKITIGETIWQGTVATGLGGTPSAIGTLPPPYTLVTELRSYPANEKFEAQIHDGDFGTFSSFPFQEENATSVINLQFSGPNTFLRIGIESLEIDPSVITVASGSIKSGLSQLQFSIDPASIKVLDLAQEPVSPLINLSTPDNNVRLNWRSSPFFIYRIERSLTLNDWTALETINGTGAAFTRLYPRSEVPEFYRIVTDTKAP